MKNILIHRKINPQIINSYLENKEEKYLIYCQEKNIPWEYQNKNITWKSWESLGAKSKREVKIFLTWGEDQPIRQASQTLQRLTPKNFNQLCPNLATKKNRWVYNKLRNALMGGWTQTFTWKKAKYQIDQNSAYAYVMISRKFPVGIPTLITKNIPTALKEGKKGFVKVQVNIKYVGKHYHFIGQEKVKGEGLIYKEEIQGTFYWHTSFYKKVRSAYRGQYKYLELLVFEHRQGKELFSELVKESQQKRKLKLPSGKLLPNLVFGLLGKDVAKKKGYNYQPISIAIATFARLNIISEMEKYKKEAIAYVKTDCLGLLEEVSEKTKLGKKLGEFKKLTI